MRITRTFSRLAPVLLAAVLAGCERGGTGSDAVESVSINPDPAYVVINTPAPLQATARTAGGRAVTGVPITWTSSDTSVAAVSAEGVVTGRRYGSVTITAAADGVRGSAALWVTGGPGLTVVTQVRDTINAVAATSLVAELRRPDGAPIFGEPVRFEVIATEPLVYPVRFLSAGDPTALRVVSTDAQGRAQVDVRMGDVAGPARVVVRDETRGTADTVEITVLPGAAVSVRVEPADSAVFIGQPLQLRGEALDRNGNRAAGTVSFAWVSGPLQVDAAGRVATPAYGASRIVGTLAGARPDTVRVTSVPVGAIAASTGQSLVVMNLDGTRRRVVANGVNPAWSPDGQTLAFVLDGLLHTARLDAPGPAFPLVKPPAGWQHGWPQYAPDGAWIYYHTRVMPGSIWRVRTDGNGNEMPGEAWWAAHPSLSPDGERMAYAYAFENGISFIRVMDLATRQVSRSLASGTTPSWSPGGEWIAFTLLDPSRAPAGIMVMRPDGSGLGRLTPVGIPYGLSPRWSPDGRWIVATLGDRAHLIQVETGTAIELPFPLPNSDGIAWRPGGVLP